MNKNEIFQKNKKHKIPVVGVPCEIVFPQERKQIEHINSQFVDIIKIAMKEWWKRSNLNDSERWTFDYIMSCGLEKYLEKMVKLHDNKNNLSKEEIKEFYRDYATNKCTLSLRVFCNTEIKNKGIHLVYEWYDLKIVDKKLEVTFYSAKKLYCSKANLVCSSKNPKVIIDDKSYVVAFTKHSIERMKERLVTESKYAVANVSVVSYIETNTHYPITELSCKQKALEVWVPASRKNKGPELIKQVIGDEFKFGDAYLIKLGYLPIEIDGRYAVCKTLLSPGMHTTPEYLLTIRNNIPDEELTFSSFAKKNDYSLLRLFDNAGWNQVLKTSGDSTIDKFKKKYGI